MDKIIPKIEHKDMLHKTNKKIGSINKLNKVLSEVYIKVINKVKSIYESMCELKDEIYNDPWLRVVELNKIKDILDDTLNLVSKEIYGKNRISSNIIDLDKHKDIDGYASKLTDVINNYIKLINNIGETLDYVICEINNETSMIDEYNLNNLKTDNKLSIKRYTFDVRDSPQISNHKKIFNKLVDDRIEKIINLDSKVKRDDLIYRYKGDISDLKFNEFDGGVDIINKIRDGKEELSDIKNIQHYFKALLGQVKKVLKNKKNK